jgi:polyphosphate kinase
MSTSESTSATPASTHHVDAPDSGALADGPVQVVPSVQSERPDPVAEPPAPTGEPDDARRPELYFNRELSWLEFNDRVLQLAEDPEQPLLERVKFCAIFSSNLDEFFMVRVAGLHDQLDAGIDKRSQDGRTAGEILDELRARVVELSARQAGCLRDDLLPALREEDIRIQSWEECDEEQRRALSERFHRQIFPVLTPLAVGLGRPFPYISNLSLSLAVLLRDPVTDTRTFARVKVPKEMLPRFVPVAEDSTTFVLLEEVIAAHLDALFPGIEILDHGCFRVTRDADFTVSDEADDLLTAVEDELRRRRFGEVVRAEVDGAMSSTLRAELTEALDVETREVYAIEGLLDCNDLWQIVKLQGFPELRDPPWTPVTQPRLRDEEGGQVDVMSAMRRGDILVHHPYDSFATSVERFVEQAVADPDVLAIKQTVYRTSDDSPLVPALIRATERGKQAVCLVELKARFDERANITWARALEEAGVHVVYGHPSLKTHAKCVLVVRREGEGVRHYVHIGTGNYHAKTARLYTDFGLFTCDERIGSDVADMFNFLTGYGRPRRYRRALVAPNFLRTGVLEEIERTIAAHRPDAPARIAMKMNSLVDGDCIRALYRASQAGVRVDLNIRGICCLRPGLPGVSDNVHVTSIVGRFLEHSRIFSFHRPDEDPVVYIGAAVLMPRNLDTRVELVVPVEDPTLRGDLLDTLERCLADDMNAWELREDGRWVRRTPGSEPRSVQRELMVGHLARSHELAS